MPTVTYRPAEVLHWFGVGSNEARHRARQKGQSALARNDLVKSIKDVAGAASEFGKSTLTDLVQRKAEDTSYQLSDDAFEVMGTTSRKRILYSDATELHAKQNDRYELIHKGGSLTIKPIAHLLAGRMRVPVGWLRNGMEVPYALLIEELAARCGVEIIPE